MASIKTAQNQHLHPAPESSVRIRLIGPFSVDAKGQSLGSLSKKAKALIAYLIQRNGIEAARGVIAGLLWGERSEDQARASLRQSLSEIRVAFAEAGQQPVATQGESVRWVSDGQWIDTRMIADAASSVDLEPLRNAVQHLRGEFLEGLDISEAGFDQWLRTERELLRRMAATILSRLMENAEQEGKFEDVLLYGQRLLGIDPLQENIHVRLMKTYMAQHRLDAALAQFERCKAILAENLGIAPAKETEQLAMTIKTTRRQPPTGAVQITPPTALPTKPSIAVLPFINLSPEATNELIADGMTDDIISGLSRVGDLFVIARSSSFTFKGQSIQAPEAAKQLGVRYVLEGSVRVLSDRIRVNAQLIDCTTGNNVWSERYDGKLDDIFAVQDEITYGIVRALEVKLARGDTSRFWEGQTKNWRAWEKTVAARNVLQRYTTANTAAARKLLEESLEIDPGNVGARALLGITHYWDARFNMSLDREDSIGLGEQQVQLLLTSGEKTSAALVLKGAFAYLRDQHQEAVCLGEQAVRLAPGDARALAFYGMFLVFAGEPERAFAPLKSAMTVTPKADSWYRYYLTLANLWSGQTALAVESAELYVQQEPVEPYGFMYLAAIHEMHSRHIEAARAIAQLRDIAPAFSIKNVKRSERYKKHETMQTVLNALARAGLPK